MSKFGRSLLNGGDEVMLNTYEIVQNLQKAGVENNELMKVISALKNGKFFDECAVVFREMEEADKEELDDDELRDLYKRMYGRGPDEEERPFVPADVADALFDEQGAKARMANTIAYADGVRERVTDFDHQWSDEVGEEDLCHVASELSKVVPQFDVDKDPSYKKKGKVERMEYLANYADELCLASESGKLPVAKGFGSNDIDKVQSFGPMYGIGKGRVKLCMSLTGKVTVMNGIPEKLVETQEVRPNDFVYTSDRIALAKALRSGHRKFASTDKNLFSDACELSTARGWYTAIYSDKQSQPEELPNAEDWLKREMAAISVMDVNDVATASAKVFTEYQIKKQEFADREKKVASGVVQPSTTEIDGEEVFISPLGDDDQYDSNKPPTEIHSFVLWLYVMLRTVPGKAYYMSNRHRKNFMSYVSNIKASHALSAKKVAQVEPSFYGDKKRHEQLENVVVKRFEVKKEEQGDFVTKVSQIVAGNMSCATLLTKKWVDKRHIKRSNELKGSGKMTFVRIVKDLAGTVCDAETLAAAIVQAVRQIALGNIEEESTILCCAAKLISVYYADAEGEFISY